MQSQASLGIILASTREGRAGERVARWVERVARERGGAEIRFVDLAEWIFPPYHHPKPPVLAEKEYTDEKQRAWVALVASLDGFVVVTPEYNHGYPAALKNALDYTYAGWNRKPVAFVSYGGAAGGVRAVEQLRLVAIELQMAPLRQEVNIPFIGRALDEGGAPKEELHRKRLDSLLAELEWWTRALAAARAG